MKQTALRIVAVLALVTAALLAPTTGRSPASTAQAANLAYFDPGNIISDAVFYDYLSMNAGDVQGFLNLKGGGCTAGSLCIKNYVVDTTNRSADSLCAGYPGAPAESAATIIAKVAASCGVSPRVLLVVLQKEQGLVTATSPTQHQYDRAAGYACPDSANGGCDPSYVGLENQLYWSAWQYKKYRANPYNYNFVAGQNNTIQWSPNAACGSSVVYIASQATAGLYDYTPYRPNQAALNAGYGTGDGCSAYGNRNFWNYFTDWFGSTQSTGGAAIYTYYQSLGGSTGQMGAPASGFFCGLLNGGCGQHFQNGSIYWSPSTGAHVVSGALRDSWSGRGWETGVLGYPIGDSFCGLANGGCFQTFQGGSLYWTAATGAHFVRGLIFDKWGGGGWENGWLGYPTSDEICGLKSGGCVSYFQNGSIFWSPSTGAHMVNPVLMAHWQTLGWESGVLGYPLSDVACSGIVGKAGSACSAVFQGGTMYWSPNTDARYVAGPTGDLWKAAGGTGSWLGYPTSDVICGLKSGGCVSYFENGSIFWSSTTGAHMVNQPLMAHWQTLGWESGVLGYPLSNVACTGPGATYGCSAVFQGGTLYWSPTTDAHFVRGSIGGLWASIGGTGSWLGYPITDETCGLKASGCFNQFQYGWIYWSPATGAELLYGPIHDAWVAAGAQAGGWGYPTANPVAVPGGIAQHFQGGTATLDTTTNQVTFQ